MATSKKSNEADGGRDGTIGLIMDMSVHKPDQSMANDLLIHPMICRRKNIVNKKSNLSCLSFLCKDREEKFKNKSYNNKDKFMFKNEEQWKNFIAVSSTKTSDEFEEYNVPASTWAIFSGTGTNQSIQE